MGNINLEKKERVDNDQDTSKDYNEPDYEQDDFGDDELSSEKANRLDSVIDSFKSLNWLTLETIFISMVLILFLCLYFGVSSGDKRRAETEINHHEYAELVSLYDTVDGLKDAVVSALNDDFISRKEYVILQDIYLNDWYREELMRKNDQYLNRGEAYLNIQQALPLKPLDPVHLERREQIKSLTHQYKVVEIKTEIARKEVQLTVLRNTLEENELLSKIQQKELEGKWHDLKVESRQREIEKRTLQLSAQYQQELDRLNELKQMLEKEK